MRKMISWTIAAMLLVICTGTGIAAEKAPQKIVDLAGSKLADMGKDPILVKAVKAENAKGKTLDQIKAIDTKWIATPGLDDFMKQLMSSECARHLQAIQKAEPFYAEIFVMDNLGANVAMTDKTSDYWQGDEAKFTESFKGGAGAVYIGEVKFDESAKGYLVHVSVPVLDGGRAIGAVTFGIDMAKIK